MASVDMDHLSEYCDLIYLQMTIERHSDVLAAFEFSDISRNLYVFFLLLRETLHDGCQSTLGGLGAFFRTITLWNTAWNQVYVNRTSGKGPLMALTIVYTCRRNLLVTTEKSEGSQLVGGVETDTSGISVSEALVRLQREIIVGNSLFKCVVELFFFFLKYFRKFEPRLDS